MHSKRSLSMKTWIYPLAVLGLAASAFGQATPAAFAAEPPVVGITWARGVEPPASTGTAGVSNAARRSANMTYHGGKIMPTAGTEAIFWGTSWGTYSGDKSTGID